MNLRLSSFRAVFNHHGKARFKARLTGHLAAVAALAFVLAGAGIGNASAAPTDAASAPDAASVSYAAGSQYTVRPGQSLNDVAIAVTQSHDRATLVRATRALFDTNPSAFMSHDPSRMRVGAVLTVPALDASGALAASSAAAEGTPAASAPNAAAPGDAASAVAQVNAAAASAASAAAHAAEPAAPAVSATASVAAGASSAVPGSSTAVGSTATSAPATGSQTAASPVSGAHEWSGSIEAPASAPGAGAQTPNAGATPATGAAQSASQPRAQVSSLQQLLALKNRVLMELQKHGIGGAPAATSGAAATGAARPVAEASSAAPGVSGHGVATVAPTSNAGIGGMSQTELSIAAAVGAGLVALLAALRMSRRKRERAAGEAASADGEMAASTQASRPQDVAATREVSGADDGEAGQHAAALAAAERAAAGKAEAERLAAEKATAERVAVERAAAERAAAEREAAERAAAEREAAEREAAERAAAERAAAERAAAEAAAAEQAPQQATSERAAAEHEPKPAQPRTDFPLRDLNPFQQGVEEQHAFEPTPPAANAIPAAESGSAAEPLYAAPRDIGSATAAASLQAAAEFGAEALPLTPLEPVDEAGQPEDHRLRWDDEPAPSAPAESRETAPESQNPQQHTLPPVIYFTQQPIESRPPTPGQPNREVSANPQPAETSVQAQPASAAPTEFPRDAVDAFNSLDMPLPPRVDSPAESAQPGAAREATAQQVAPHEPDDAEAPHIAGENAAGTAAHAAIAGLGGAGFGALKLDFDLELPPSPAQPLPAFTQADLVRIARNKLDLASEYIELGDLSGARALINEVIEANDPATRTQARALLLTLAPLS